jgi:hypothetical protein
VYSRSILRGLVVESSREIGTNGRSLRDILDLTASFIPNITHLHLYRSERPYPCQLTTTAHPRRLRSTKSP